MKLWGIDDWIDYDDGLLGGQETVGMTPMASCATTIRRAVSDTVGYAPQIVLDMVAGRSERMAAGRSGAAS